MQFEFQSVVVLSRRMTRQGNSDIHVGCMGKSRVEGNVHPVLA